MRALRGAVSALCIAVAASLLLFGGSVRIASERTLDADRFAADAVGAMRTKTGLATTLRFIDDGVLNSRNGKGLGVGLENLEQRVRHFGGADASVSAGQAEAGGFAVTLRWRSAAAPVMAERPS